MSPARVFTAFDYEHDESLRNLLVGQSRNPDSPFEMHDWSVKELFTGDWKAKVNDHIRKVDQVIMSLELYGLARLLMRNGEYLRAGSAYERAITSGLPDDIDQKARHELARLAKRLKDFDRAVELWSGLCEGSSLNLEAHEQLAIHYERRVGDMPAAERVTRSAITKLRDARGSGLIQTSHTSRFLVGFERRLKRLGAAG